MPDKAMSNLSIWLNCARPKTLWAAVAPVLIGAAMAYNSSLNWLVLAATVAAATLIQIGTNFANDYYDFLKGADVDRTGPVRATQSGQVKPAQMKAAFIITFALAAILGLYLTLVGGLPIIIIGAASIIFGVLYTGGPYPLGYHGFGDILVLIFFGPVAVGGTYYLLSGSINAQVVIAGLAPGLLSTAILTVNNFRDYYTDKAAGKKTLVVRFGRLFGKCEYTFCIVTSFAVPIYLWIAFELPWQIMLSLFAAVFAIKPIKDVCSDAEPAVLNHTLAQTGKLLIIYSMLFSIGFVI